MTGRYEARPERQNEYFIPGEGISREVIQADICRYLGNDALVRPGNHNVRPPFCFFLVHTMTGHSELTMRRAAQDSLSVPIGISHL
jgi:hypothetical protein